MRQTERDRESETEKEREGEGDREGQRYIYREKERKSIRTFLKYILGSFRCGLLMPRRSCCVD